MNLVSKAQKEWLTRPEIKFWLAIIALVVSGAVCFNTLKMEVGVLGAKTIKHEKEYKEVGDVLKEIRESQIRMEKDIEFIYKELGGDNE